MMGFFNLAQDNVTTRFVSSVGVMDRRSFSSPGARCRSKRRQLWRWRAYRWDKRTLHMCCTFPESHLTFWLLPQVTSADEHFQHLKSTVLQLSVAEYQSVPSHQHFQPRLWRERLLGHPCWESVLETLVLKDRECLVSTLQCIVWTQDGHKILSNSRVWFIEAERNLHDCGHLHLLVKDIFKAEKNSAFVENQMPW